MFDSCNTIGVKRLEINLTCETIAPTCGQNNATSERTNSTCGIVRPTFGIGGFTSEKGALTSEVDRLTSERKHSTSEGDRLTSEKTLRRFYNLLQSRNNLLSIFFGLKRKASHYAKPFFIYSFNPVISIIPLRKLKLIVLHFEASLRYCVIVMLGEISIYCLAIRTSMKSLQTLK